MNRTIALSAAVLGFLCVALGAFGAHWLKTHTDAHGLEVWRTAAHYQGLHAVALLALAGWKRDGRWTVRAAQCWVAGIAFFSGSLYLLVLTDVKWLGAVTPVGGLLLLAGWVLIGVAAWRK